MKAWILVVTCLAVFVGCSADQFESEREDDDLLDVNTGECRQSSATGCLQGQVPAAPDLVVGGEKFFDANDLAAKFKNLLPTVHDTTGKALVADDFDLKWITKLDNESFSDGFHIYLKGASARNQRVMSNGAFAVNRLQPGYYQIRVQKEFKFVLAQRAISASAAEGQTDSQEKAFAPEPLKAAYCATLYAKDSVEIRRGYKTGTVVFDHFDVELVKCGASEGEAKIKLNE
jgi:hypothetical protein